MTTFRPGPATLHIRRVALEAVGHYTSPLNFAGLLFCALHVLNNVFHNSAILHRTNCFWHVLQVNLGIQTHNEWQECRKLSLDFFYTLEMNCTGICKFFYHKNCTTFLIRPLPPKFDEGVSNVLPNLGALPCFQVPRHKGGSPSAGQNKTWKNLWANPAIL
jgi:hypothetical protein